ncbi:trehalase-like domain-containing protein [Micromonospora sp. CB01531]|uniref:trehalase-like domain-containing protein n=1 Tax=Micromonospora sp. CB01531 TaxID=1718947 RepID=UPI003FD5C4F1
MTSPPPSAPISDYGLLGDTRTAALVASDGRLDWLCVPHFDGEPLFGRLVGGPEAGTFRVGPAGPAPVVERRYRQNTATLETTWAVSNGRLTLTEGMVAEISGHLLPTSMIVRRLSAEDETVDAVVEFNPRLGVRHRRPRVHQRRQALCVSGDRSPSRWAAHPNSPSNRVGPPRSRSAQAVRSLSCWPWPTANLSSTSSRQQPGTCSSRTRADGGPGPPKSTNRCRSGNTSHEAC